MSSLVEEQPQGVDDSVVSPENYSSKVQHIVSELDMLGVPAGDFKLDLESSVGTTEKVQLVEYLNTLFTSYSALGKEKATLNDKINEILGSHAKLEHKNSELSSNVKALERQTWELEVRKRKVQEELSLKEKKMNQGINRLQKANMALRHKDVQFQHQIRKNELEYRKLQDSLTKVLQRGGHGKKNQTKGVSFTANAAVSEMKGRVSKSQANLLQKALVSAQKRLEDLVQENGLMRNTVSMFQSSLVKALFGSMDTSTDTVGDKGEVKEASDKAALFASLPESTRNALQTFQQAKMDAPFEQIEATVNDAIDAHSVFITAITKMIGGKTVVVAAADADADASGAKKPSFKENLAAKKKAAALKNQEIEESVAASKKRRALASRDPNGKISKNSSLAQVKQNMKMRAVEDKLEMALSKNRDLLHTIQLMKQAPKPVVEAAASVVVVDNSTEIAAALEQKYVEDLGVLKADFELQISSLEMQLLTAQQQVPQGKTFSEEEQAHIVQSLTQQNKADFLAQTVEFENTLTQLRDSLAAKQAFVVEFEAALTVKTEEYTTLQGSFEGLTSKVTSLEAALEESMVLAEQSDAINKKLTVQVTELETALAAAQKQIKEAATGYECIIEEQAEKISTLEQTMTDTATSAEKAQMASAKKKEADFKIQKNHLIKEVKTLSNALENKTSELNAITETVANFDAVRAELQGTITALEAQIQTHQTDISGLNKEIVTFQEAHAAKEVEQAAAVEEITASKALVTDLEAQLTALRSSFENVSSNNEATAATVEDLEAKLVLAKEFTTSLEATLVTKDTELTELSAKLATATTQAEETTTVVSTVQQQLSELQASFDSKSAAHDKAISAGELISDMLKNERVAHVIATEKLVETTQALTAAQKEITSLQMEKDCLEKNVADLSNNLSSTEAGLQKELTQVKLQHATVSAELKSKATEMRGLTQENEASLLELQAKYEREVAAEVAAKNTALDKVQQVSANLAGRIQCMETEKKALESTVTAADAQVSSLKQAQTALQTKVDVMDTEKIQAEQVVRTLKAELVTLQSELSTLNSKLASGNNNIASERQYAKEQAETFSADLKAARVQAREAQALVNATKLELTEAVLLVKTKTKEAAALNKHARALEGDIDDAMLTLKELKTANGKLSQDLKESQGQTTKVSNDLKAAHSLMKKKIAEFTQFADKDSHARQNMSEEVVAAKVELKSVQATVGVLKEEVSTLNEKNQTLSDQLAVLEMSKNNTVTASNNKLTATTTALSGAKEQVKTLTVQNRDLSQTVQGQQRQISELEATFRRTEVTSAQQLASQTDSLRFEVATAKKTEMHLKAQLHSASEQIAQQTSTIEAIKANMVSQAAAQAAAPKMVARPVRSPEDTENLTKQVAQLQEIITESMTELYDQKEAHKVTQAKYAQLLADSKKSTLNVEQTQKIAQVTTENDALAQQVAQLKSQLAAANNRVSETAAEKQSLSKSANSKVDSFKQQIDMLQDACGEKDSTVEHLKQQLTVKASALNDAVVKQEHLCAEIAEAQAAEKIALKQVKQLQTQMKSFRAVVDNANNQQVMDLRAGIDADLSEMRSMKQKIAHPVSRSQTTRSRHLREDIKTSYSQVKKLETNILGLSSGVGRANTDNKMLAYLCKTLVKTNYKLENDLQHVMRGVKKRDSLTPEELRLLQESYQASKKANVVVKTPTAQDSDMDKKCKELALAAQVNERLVERFQKIVKVLEKEVSEKDSLLKDMQDAAFTQ